MKYIKRKKYKQIAIITLFKNSYLKTTSYSQQRVQILQNDNAQM